MPIKNRKPKREGGRKRWLALCAIAVALHPIALRAQQHVTVADLSERVSPTVRLAVTALVDSAVAAGLPAAPLVDKALEGASKRASDERIVVAVRTMAADLGTAQRALGRASSEPELTAAVAALRAGAAPGVLAELRRVMHGRTVTVPLSVLGTLLVQGVPASLASAAVLHHGPRDDDTHLLAAGGTIARSVANGVPPATALAAWLPWRGEVTSLSAPPGPPRSSPASPQKP